MGYERGVTTPVLIIEFVFELICVCKFASSDVIDAESVVVSIF